MTDFPRCKTCKHWTQDKLTLDWEAPAWGECGVLPGPHLEIEVDADTGYRSVKLTPWAEFGCVHHEAKP